MQDTNRKRDVSILNWMGTLFLLCIPGVNLVMLFVWAFTAKSHSKRTFVIASLIWIVILIVLGALALAFYGDQTVDWLKQQYTVLPVESPVAAPIDPAVVIPG